MTNSKSYSGLFKQSILGPPGWQWATANLAPCPTVNPCEKSFTHSPWNLCYRRELTCGTPYTRATLCHTHGISIVLQQSLLQQNPVNCVHSFFLLIKRVMLSVVCSFPLNALTAWIADSQEPAQRAFVTKEFLEFFMPSVQIELDPNEKEFVTHVYIRGPTCSHPSLDIFISP